MKATKALWRWAQRRLALADREPRLTAEKVDTAYEALPKIPGTLDDRIRQTRRVDKGRLIGR